MYASARVNPSSAAEQLKAQMLRAQQLQEHFHSSSEYFRRWMSRYHQQMQRFYTKKIDYHERMKQLYMAKLLDNVAPLGETVPVEVDTVMPTTTAVMAGATTDVTDRQWLLIAPLLPLGNGRGRPYADDRRTLNGILFVTTHHVGWSHMPPRYGSYVTCWRRYLRWQNRGVWTGVQQVLQPTAASEARDVSVTSSAHADTLAFSAYTSR